MAGSVAALSCRGELGEAEGTEIISMFPPQLQEPGAMINAAGGSRTQSLSTYIPGDHLQGRCFLWPV